MWRPCRSAERRCATFDVDALPIHDLGPWPEGLSLRREEHRHPIQAHPPPRALTSPANSIAPPNNSKFSAKVVLPMVTGTRCVIDVGKILDSIFVR